MSLPTLAPVTDVSVPCRVTQEDGKELQVSTKKFQSGNIRYDLYDDASQLSNVFTIDNQGRISNLQVKASTARRGMYMIFQNGTLNLRGVTGIRTVFLISFYFWQNNTCTSAKWKIISQTLMFLEGNYYPDNTK